MAGFARMKMWLVAALALVLVVQGCREEEQNRPLPYEKGTYRGKMDPPLSEEQIEQLRQRARAQRY